MKIHCDIIQDLLPSYLDDICSKRTKDLVEEHLKECSTCNELIRTMQSNIIIKNDVSEAKKPWLKVKKNTFIKVVVSFIIAPIICFSLFVGWCTFSGEGLSLDALLFRDKAERFLQSLSIADYETASQHLSFYGFDHPEELREEWKDNMNNLDIDFVKMHWTPLYADDGIACCYATVTLNNNEIMEFRVSVQGNGLSVSSIYVHNDEALTERMQEAMIAHNPG